VSLEVDVQHRFGDFALDARFASQGRVSAFFGRSGSGKTSLVHVIAGLVRPEKGRVVVRGQVLVDTEQRIFVPSHRRRIGCVFQDGRLFPHLTVRQNLLYGARVAPRAERSSQLAQVVALLGIEALLARRPDALSGGEKQRVAIGRALLATPQLLLMDEPLASLDRDRKAEILPYLERLRDEIQVPMIYVSHSVAEVARLADTLIVFSAGRVAGCGPTQELIERFDLARATDSEDLDALHPRARSGA
jgi:molybdate transport system ATP-binding protein